MSYEDAELDMVKLEQMLKDGVPGPKIREVLGVSLNEQVTFAKAWRIERKIGRPKRTAEELSVAFDNLIKKMDDNDVVIEALAMTLRTLGDRTGPTTKAKLAHLANEVADLKVGR